MSLRPDSFDVYTIHRASGDNSTCPSVAGDVRNGIGLRSPTSGSTQTSDEVFPPSLSKTMNRPSADQLRGDVSMSVLSSTSSGVAPPAGLTYRFMTPPVRLDENTTRDPSGDQCGAP